MSGSSTWYSGSGTWYLPADTTSTYGQAQGAGGGGGGSESGTSGSTPWSASGGGGGGGGIAYGGFPPNNISYAVGDGGTAGLGYYSGAGGGASILGRFYGYGGYGGTGGNYNTAGVGGGGSGAAGAPSLATGATGGNGSYNLGIGSYGGNGGNGAGGGLGGGPGADGGEGAGGGGATNNGYQGPLHGGHGGFGKVYISWVSYGSSITGVYNMSGTYYNAAYQGTSQEFYITGSGFNAATAIDVLGHGNNGWAINGDNQIFFNTPIVAQQSVFGGNITLYQPYGNSTVTFYLYPNIPTFTSCSPTFFWETSPSTCVVQGTYFDVITSVTDNHGNTLGYTINSTNQITLTMPSFSQQSPFSSTITITNQSGSCSFTVTYYPNTPTITSISSSIIDEAGGVENAITVTGTYLSLINSATFGTESGTIHSSSPTSLVLYPPSAYSPDVDSQILTVSQIGYPGANSASYPFKWQFSGFEANILGMCF